MALPGKESSGIEEQQEDGSKIKIINISRIYDQKFNIITQKMYSQVKDDNLDDDKDQPNDVNGYNGYTQYYRTQYQLNPISEESFIKIIAEDNKMDQVMLTIKQIDKDHNGYVTRNELDDILKLFYKNQLESKDLTMIIKRFGSIQNKILIDYKSFKSWIRNSIDKL